MKGFKIALSICFTLYCINTLISQEVMKPVNIQSPNVASLGLYGDVPVSYHSGTPQVNIPIHTLSVNNIDLNITLAYNASGVRLNQHPGWVGQNWSLVAGGVIVRTIIGDNDEFTSHGCGGGYLEDDIGYLYRGSELNENDLQNDEKFKNIYATNRTYHGYDYEPDIFTFNFLGKTGKFFLGEDGNWKVSSESNLKVVMKPDLITPLFEEFGWDAFIGYKYPKVIGGFELIDDQGNIYKFGYDENAIEYSISFFHQVCYGPSNWYANAWYLTSVTDKHGNELYSFLYERNEFIAHLYRHIVSKRYSVEHNCGFFNINCMQNGCAPWANINSTNVDGNLISPVYLSEIQSIYGDHVTFTRSETTEITYNYDDISPTYNKLLQLFPFTNYYWIFYLQMPNPYIQNPYSMYEFLDNLKWYKLDNIYVTNTNQSKVKRVNFNYNNLADKRLCLQSLDFVTDDWPNNPEKASYSFEYDRFELLPGYLSRKVDHWGYNNGTPYPLGEPSLINHHYDDRQTNPEYTSIGILNLIVYPTGGWTYFQYEPNSFSQIVSNDRATLYSENGIGGGLRVKKIVDFDGKSKEEKEFIYAINYSNSASNLVSSGILTGKPKYYWNGFHLRWYESSNVYADYYAYTFSNNSLIPHSNFFGVIVGYSEVVEKRTNNSYITYKYSNYDNNNSFFFDGQPINTFHPEASIYHPYSELSILRGKLIEKIYYDSQNNKTLSNIYTYRSDINDMMDNYVLATNARYESYCQSAAYHAYYGNAYKIYYFDYDIVEEKTINYFDGTQVVKQTNFVKEDIDIDNNKIRLLKETTEVNSKNEEITTELYYPHDLPTEPFMQSLIDNRRFGEIVKTNITNDNAPIGYKATEYKNEGGLIVPAMLKTSSTDNLGQLEVIYFDEYDQQGNVLQYHKENGVCHSFIRGYYNRHVVAEIENETYAALEPFVDEIQSESNGDYWHCFNSELCSENDLRIQLDNLRENFPEARITTYTYDPGIGITSITEPNEYINYFFYDELNRLEFIYDLNENIIKKFEYNYFDGLYYDVVESSIYTTAFELCTPVTFYNPGVIGGSGDYTFNWELKKGTQVLESYSSNDGYFATLFPEYGDLSINCQIVDNITGFSKNTISFFAVSITTLDFEFTNIVNPPTSAGYEEERGTINCPGYDVIEFSLRSRTTDSDAVVTIIIGEDGYYQLTPMQHLTVLYDVIKGQEVECVVKIENGVIGSAAELEISGLECHTGNIGSPNMLHVDIDQ